MDEISNYKNSFDESQRLVLELLRNLLDAKLGSENSRVWHGAPVWFVGENPVAGYSVNSRGVCLLFWNGQNFKNHDLHKVGKFFAAEKRYSDVSEVDEAEISPLIDQSKELVWDSVSFFREKREGSQSK
jgi:hypothetical protein